MAQDEKTPISITPDIIELCNSIIPEQVPYYVEVSPTSWSIISECFHNVDKMVRLHGGKKIMGRAIWQWANIMIEAEAHAIWESPDGNQIDITPNSYHENKILFLCDANLTYKGISIRNIRKALTQSPLVQELIEICTQFEDLTCSTTEKEVGIPKELLMRRIELTQMMKRKAGRNDMCPCGSGNKYKKCCGY